MGQMVRTVPSTQPYKGDMGTEEYAKMHKVQEARK